MRTQTFSPNRIHSIPTAVDCLDTPRPPSSAPSTPIRSKSAGFAPPRIEFDIAVTTVRARIATAELLWQVTTQTSPGGPHLQQKPVTWWLSPAPRDFLGGSWRPDVFHALADNAPPQFAADILRLKLGILRDTLRNEIEFSETPLL